MSNKLDELSEAIGCLRATSEAHAQTLREIKDELHDMNRNWSDNTKSLQEHMMQTSLVRERTELMKEELDLYKQQMAPVEETVKSIKWLANVYKFLIPLLGIPTAAYYILKIMHEFLGH
jgi:cob(I)alamin adenosyltransferase